VHLPVTAGSRLVGILSDTDVLSAFTELFTVRQGARRLEVELPHRPGELGQVVRVIGLDHRISITGMVVSPLESGDGCMAIIHLEVPDASSVVDALRRMGYRAGSPSIAADPDVDLVTAGPAAGTRSRERALAEL
jgi:acetoin utilization protein AcuB